MFSLSRSRSLRPRILISREAGYLKLRRYTPDNVIPLDYV